MKNIHHSLFLIVAASLCVMTASEQTVNSQTEKLDPTAIYAKAEPSAVFIRTVTGAGEVFNGSGVIIREDGVIATNFHVMERAVSAQVRTKNGDVFDDVAILDTDERKDVAIIKIKAINLPTLRLANSDEVKVGATVYALGAPSGLAWTFTPGMVNALRPVSEMELALSGFRVIQFSAPVAKGSSGGPLLDEQCRVIGLVFWSRQTGQNLNFAVPSNYVASLVANLSGQAQWLTRMPMNLEQRASTGGASSAPGVAAPAKPTVTGTAAEITGTYTGKWSSEMYQAGGQLVLKITVSGNHASGSAYLTGSDEVQGDDLQMTLTDMGSGVWRLNYKGKKVNLSGSGIFKNGQFIGDYRYRKLIWLDRGKWILAKSD